MINYYQPRSFKNLEDEMKRMVLLVVLATFVILPNTALAQETNQRIAVSPAFATAQEAVNFANSLPFSANATAKFVCEYHSGSTIESSFSVVYRKDKTDPTHLLEWHNKEFPSPHDAVKFRSDLDDKLAPPEYTTCWNPRENPAGTTTVIFTLHQNNPWHNEYSTHGPFTSAESAASWANENACSQFSVDFVSETNTATQTEPIWYVITREDLDCKIKPNRFAVWRVADRKTNTKDIVETINRNESISGSFGTHLRLPTAFNTWGIHGEVVLFVLEPVASEPIKNDDQEKEIEPAEEMPKENSATEDVAQNKPELILPVRIFATKTLLEKSDSERLREITNTAVNSFHEQINFVRLETTAEIQQAPQIASSDPVILGNSLPYVPNTLAIFFTDQNLLIPKTSKDSERSITGRAGRSWVVMNVNVCDGCNIKPEGVLLHEILHEFGVPHKQDPTSVMCADLIIKSCPRNTMIIDGKSLAEANGATKLIKKIGFDTYTGLATRF